MEKAFSSCKANCFAYRDYRFSIFVMSVLRWAVLGYFYALPTILLAGVTRINLELSDYKGSVAVLFCGHVAEEQCAKIGAKSTPLSTHIHAGSYCIDADPLKAPDLCGSILDPEVQEYLWKNGAGRFDYVFVEVPPSVRILENLNVLKTLYAILKPNGKLLIPMETFVSAEQNIIFAACFDELDFFFQKYLDEKFLKNQLIASKKLGIEMAGNPLNWETIKALRRYQQVLNTTLAIAPRFVRVFSLNHVYDRHEKKFIVIPIWPFLPQLQQVFFYEYFRLLQKTGFSLKIFKHMPLGVPENEVIVATAASKSHVKYVTASLFAKRVGRRLCTTCAEK